MGRRPVRIPRETASVRERTPSFASTVAEAVPFDFWIEPSKADDVRVVSHAVEPLEHAREIVVPLTYSIDRKGRVLDVPARCLTDCRSRRHHRQLVRRDVDSFTEETLTAFDDEGGELCDIRDRDLL